jgi:hypothetical protein
MPAAAARKTFSAGPFLSRQVRMYGTLIGAVLLSVHSSFAADEQTAQLQRQTERLQRQIDALQQQLQVLQRQVAETKRAQKSPLAGYGGGHETKSPASPQANAKAWKAGSTPLGYGNPLFDNSGCFTENPASGPTDPNDPITKGTCAANTRSSNEITVGFWQDVYKGYLGRLVLGGQYEYVKRNTFPGLVNGTITPGPNPVEQIVMTSIRYYPFQ